VNFSALVERVRGEGAVAWRTHYAAVAARERGADVIILSVGDPDLDTPAPVIERAIHQLRAGDTHYLPTAGRLALREAIARAHTRRSGQVVGAENVIYLAGAQNALFVSSLCLAGPGDEVLALEPLYPTYTATIEVSGARLVPVPATAACRPDMAALAKLIGPRTRAILWASPNNPSGVVLNEAELEAIGEFARRHQLWLICDEVYAGLAPSGRVPSLGARLPDRVVTLGSLSKSHAMTGWRAGWLVGPRELTLHAEHVAMCMLFGLPGFIQEAVITGIAGIPGLQPLPPEAGMFMLIDVSATGLSGAEFVQALYATQGVSVMDGAAFGASTARCVRVCFATDESTLDRACARLREFCKHHLPKKVRAANAARTDVPPIR
jgi:aspartate/methionine/tyrosine aminotransferase